MRTPASPAARNLAALALIGTCALIWSTMPLIAVASALATPVYFLAIVRISGASTTALLVTARWPKLTLRSLRPNTLFPEGIRSPVLPALAIATIGKFEWLAYFAALTLTGIHVTVLVLETWPTIMIITLVSLNRGNGRYGPTSALTAAAVAGTGTLSLPEILNGQTSVHTAGTLLAFLAALMAGTHSAVIVRAGEAATPSLTSRGLSPSTIQARTFTTLWLQSASQLLAAAALVTLATLVGEHITPGHALAAALFGFLSSGATEPLFRLGTAIADSAATASALYLTPVIALLWLHLHQGLDPASTALTVLGAALLIGANATVAATTTTTTTTRHRENQQQ